MARSPHSWKKRVKELARKEKAEEKMKRRQNKSKTESTEKITDNRKED